MSGQEQGSRHRLSDLYHLIMRAHSAVPFRFFRGGYAFPAWHYFLEVTRRCNLRCAMCQYSLWYEKTPAAAQAEGELTTDEWKRVIDQMGRFSLLTFTGGEPFVREDLMALLEHAGQHRRTHVITNGNRVTDERAAACVALAPHRLGGKGLNFVGVSLEGTAEIHDRIVRKPGAYERTTAAVRALARHRAAAKKRCPHIHLTVVIQEENIGVLPEMARIAAEAGADVLNLEVEIRFHDIQGMGDALPCIYGIDQITLPRIDATALQQALSATEEAAKKAGIELRLPRMPREDIVRYYSGGIDLNQFQCRSPWTNVYIGAKGDVFPCFIYRIGNVRENSLKAIWNGPRMRQFRQHLQQRPFEICQGCCHLEHKRVTTGAEVSSSDHREGSDAR